MDANLQDKIRKSEYVEFARLLPRDRHTLEDGQLELINRGGQTFFVSASERDNAYVISNYHKWEQAFRIYSKVYLQTYPQEATELLQYNHVIFTASLSYVWDNVYTYDKEFRSHLAAFLNQSWGIILQQAWSMCLKDKVNHNSNFGTGGRFGTSTPKSKKEACK